mgnify:CR=1 FL=1
MGSASTHPHLDNKSVRWLGEALSEGVLRTAALIMPCGWRGPIVPDVIGRITGADANLALHHLLARDLVAAELDGADRIGARLRPCGRKHQHRKQQRRQ